jgi:quinol-cytochrome oxidoreductase complex cytochrome b subunit
MRFVKSNFLLSFISNAVIFYPAPSNLNYFWNFGFYAGLCLVIQILTGIFLSMYYVSDQSMAMWSVEHIMRDVNFGWLVRYAHANGASMFFVAVYCHILRGMYYGSYFHPRSPLWSVGVLIFFFMIVTAFIGYVLPWGQMSFWAATVITSLVSVIPFVGFDILIWLWGGYSVDNATLNRFFSLHYLFPFIILALVFVHLVLLHQDGSNNSMGISYTPERVSFSPFYIFKDFFGIIVFLFVFSIFIFFFPNVLGHSDNYIMANPMVTPSHIVPEWYFLPFYAILRSIPDKLFGVLTMVLSIVILVLLPYLIDQQIRSATFVYFFRLSFYYFVVVAVFLTWLGSQPAEFPYVGLSQFFTFLYFFYFFCLLPFLSFVQSGISKV